MSRLLLVAFVFVYSCGITLSQQPTYYLNPNKRLYQYNLETWSTDNGLPTNSLLSLCQSKNGYIWIGSYDGLIRFDGQRFKIYHQYNAEELKTNNIRRIIESDDGTIWMATQGSGLVSFKNGKFKNYGLDQNLSNLYRALRYDSKGRLWGTSPDEGWFYFENGEFTFVKYAKSLKDIEVRSIVEDKSGGIWFGTLGSGLYRYNEGKFKVFQTKDGLLNNWVYALYVDRKGVLWIGTSEGLCFFDGEKFHEYSISNVGTINDIIEDDYGNLWFSATTGLYRYNQEKNILEHLDAERGLKHNFINDLLFDFEGDLWMTNYKGGLSQLKDGKFTNYTAIGGLHGKVVNAICELDSNIFLTAFDNGNLSLINNGNIEPYIIKSQLFRRRIRHILKDSKNSLWFSTYSGLLKVTKEGKETWYNSKTGFPDTRIRVAYEDSKGRIWVGTRNNGLARINQDNTISIFDVSTGLSANLIMSIEEMPDGKMLIGTSEGIGGLNIMEEDKVIAQYSIADGLASDVVFNTYTDSSGYTWIAANGGLCILKDGKIKSFTMKDGLSDETPFDILEDSHGFLWLPCSKGIMRVHRNEFLNYTDENQSGITCVLFDKNDGMNQSECNPTTKSVKASNGTLLFPTIDGVAQIDPMYIPVNNYYPPVIVEDLITDEGAIHDFKNISINSKNKRITFHYTALSFYEPEEIVFRYQLEGFEDDWVDAGNSRSVSYTNLSPGQYSFKVIASNNDGVWNYLGTTVKFSVEPKFHETIWFVLLLIFVTLSLVLILYKFRVRQLNQKQLELESLVQKRTSEILIKNQLLENQKSEIENQAALLENQSKELKTSNASKDKIFSIIAHDLRGPLGNFRTILDIFINEPDTYTATDRQEMLLLLSENAKSTYELLENLLNWSVSKQGLIACKQEEFPVAPVINDIFSIVVPMAVKKQITVLNKVDESIEVYADLNMTRLIFRNLISNAIKFTEEKGEIIVTAHVKGEMVEFGIRDNGIGISEEVKENLFDQLESTLRIGTHSERGSGLGLILCKEFVENNGGEIHVESELNKGSTFKFSLKRSK
jgi:ligand-binding sensor domain-containing protein/signal transduction histidine kinase